jgi:hypothetical protein
LIQASAANHCHIDALGSLCATEQSESSVRARENSSMSRLKNRHSSQDFVPGLNLETLLHTDLLMKLATASVTDIPKHISFNSICEEGVEYFKSF